MIYVLCLPFFFFLLLLPHTALCTPDRAQAYLKPAWWQGRLERGRMWGGREGWYFSIHISTVAFLVYFSLRPQKLFQLPEIQVIKLSPEVRLPRLGACALHAGVYVACAHREHKPGSEVHRGRKKTRLGWLPKALGF